MPGANLDDVMGADSSIDAEMPESGQAVISLLERLFFTEQIRMRALGDRGTEGYAGMGMEELAHTFAVARQLKELSLQASGLNALQGRATCWWAIDRPLSDRQALALQIDQDQLRSIELDADHFTIVRKESLLLGIASALAAIPPLSKETGLVG